MPHQKMMPIGWRNQSRDLADATGAQLLLSVMSASATTAPPVATVGARQLNRRAGH